jgi:hypothetical protein
VAWAHARTRAAIVAAVRDFDCAETEVEQARRSPPLFGGSTTCLSGIGACEAIADDVVNMRPLGRFSQSFIPLGWQSNLAGNQTSPGS